MQLVDLADEFKKLTESMIIVLGVIPSDRLYWKPFTSRNHVRIYSCGELISHAMGTLEVACNGILNNFWDDPFEWTLREALPTHDHLRQYIAEVSALIDETFGHLRDEDCAKQIYLPEGNQITIGLLLLRSLLHAIHHRGQLYAYVHLFSEAKLPRTY